MTDGNVTRRNFVRKGTAMGLAGAAVGSASGKPRAGDKASPVDRQILPGGMPFGTIGDLKISRLILGITLGIGGHSLEVPIQCERLGIKPDFYVKTFHDDNYWSATPKEYRKPFCWYDESGGNSYSGKTNDHNQFHDNIWCLAADPTEMTDLAASRPGKLEELTGLWEAWNEASNARP